MPQPEIVVAGDLMMDVTAIIATDIAFASDTPARVSLQPGGSAANTAAWLAARGHAVTLVGCIGRDGFASTITSVLGELGVTLRLSSTADVATGTCVVIVDRNGERTMFPDSGANSAFAADQITDLELPAGTHVHLSGYMLLNPDSRPAGLALLARARDAGATISLDPSSAGPLREALPLFREILPSVDVLIANEAEAAVLTGAAPSRAALDILRESVPTVVIKMGARGVLASDGQASVEMPALAVTAVDTTGAGDAFTAGFLPIWTAGGGLATAVAAGQEVAAQAVCRVGASPMVA